MKIPKANRTADENGNVRTSFGRCHPKFRKRLFLRICCLLFAIVFSGIGMLLGISTAVCCKTKQQIYTAEQLIELGNCFDYVLILGCRVYEDGTPSPMLSDRITVGTSLLLSGVATEILMSGDSHTPYYDEVGCMRKSAIALGAPENAVLTDPYGLSTYDSIARAVKLFQGKRVIIVTQQYHLYRALYIAQKLGVSAVGVCADLRPYVGQSARDVREVLARCKDVFYCLKQPSVGEL